MDLEIKEVGTKLKELRKALGIKQDEVVRYSTNGKEDKPFTRNLISMIETGNAAVTPALRSCIEYNINRVIEEKQMKVDIDFDEIFMSTEEYGIYLVDELIENIGNKISKKEVFKYGDKLIEILEEKKLYREIVRTMLFLLTKYEIKEKIQEQLGRIDKLKVFNSLLTEEEKVEIAGRAKFCYTTIKEFQKALDVPYNSELENNENVNRCMYNDMVCLGYLKRWDEISLEAIKKLCNNVENRGVLYVGAKIMEANHYMVKQQNAKALKIYYRLLNMDILPDNRLTISMNIIDIHVDNGEVPKEMIEQVIESIFVYDIASDLYYNKGIEKIESFVTKSDDFSNIELWKKCIDRAIEKKSKEHFNKYIIKFLNDIDLDDSEDLTELQMFVLSGISSDLFQDEAMMKILLRLQNEKKYAIAKNIMERAASREK